MPDTKKNRLAKGLRWTARVIGFGVTVVLFIASLFIINYGKYIIADILLLFSFGISLAGCIDNVDDVEGISTAFNMWVVTSYIEYDSDARHKRKS